MIKIITKLCKTPRCRTTFSYFEGADKDYTEFCGTCARDRKIWIDKLKRPISRDCRVGRNECPDYRVKIDGKWTLQNKMFTRADMSFWNYTVGDVEPPPGYTLEFFALGSGEPFFQRIEGSA